MPCPIIEQQHGTMWPALPVASSVLYIDQEDCRVCEKKGEHPVTTGPIIEQHRMDELICLATSRMWMLYMQAVAKRGLHCLTHRTGSERINGQRIEQLSLLSLCELTSITTSSNYEHSADMTIAL